MGMGMKSLKWERIDTKNLFPHTSTRGAKKSTSLPIPATVLTHAKKQRGLLELFAGPAPVDRQQQCDANRCQHQQQQQQQQSVIQVIDFN